MHTVVNDGQLDKQLWMWTMVLFKYNNCALSDDSWQTNNKIRGENKKATIVTKR